MHAFTAQTLTIDETMQRNRLADWPAVVSWDTTCVNCQGAHHAQACPEIRAALAEQTPAEEPARPDIFDTLLVRSAQIAYLRQVGYHAAATNVREDTLNLVEAWLDPAAAAIRAEQLAADRARVTRLIEGCHEMARQVDDVCGF